MHPLGSQPQSPAGQFAGIPVVLFFFLAIVFFVLSGCAALGTGGLNLISVEKEWEIGQQFEAQLAEELEVSEDPTLTAMGNRIVAFTRKAELLWRFYVVQDDAVNAFNVPGGLVYVNSGG